jgi:thiamine-monophosphate kinase
MTAIVGEAAIIQQYFAPLAGHYSGAFGLRDDAATITPPPGHDLVVSVDAIAAGVHFFPNDDPSDIGWKALAVNVSDLVAKGAVPHAYVMALALPEPPTAAWMSAFTHGLDQAQRAFAITLVGGDTDRRPGPLSITITAFGFVPTGRMVRRGTACVGDHVFVSGTLGDAALGLRLSPGWDRPPGWRASDAQAASLRARYLRPQPRCALAPVVREWASASMDLSDGLAKDIGRMCAASGVGALLDATGLPLSAAARGIVEAHPDVWSLIATGGDDYEILATTSGHDAERFVAAAAAVGVPVTAIGRICSGHGIIVSGPDGRPLSFDKDGYDHF